MKTFTPTPKDIQRDWYVVDANNKTLGRLAAQIAHRLRGKHKPEFAPHMDNGDFIIVINADKIKVTGQKATGAFMQLTSTEPVRLVEAQSAAAKIVEIHEMRMDGDRMMMKAVPGLDIVPGKALDLKPGGYHVMLIDVVKPLNAGDKVPLTLVVEGADRKRATIEVSAEVRALNDMLALMPVDREARRRQLETALRGYALEADAGGAGALLR